MELERLADQYQTYLKLAAELQMNQVEKKEQKRKTVVAEKKEEQKKSWTEN